MSLDLATLVGVFLTISTAYIIYYHFKVFSFWKSRGIKGPMPVPIFGTNLIYLLKPKVLVDTELTQKYGAYVGLFNGYTPKLLVTDNELVAHICVTNFRSFQDRDDKGADNPNVKRWLFFAKGDHWNNVRVLSTPMFTNSKLKSMLQLQLDSVRRLLDHIKSKSLKQAKQLYEMSKGDLMALALDTTSRAFFNIKLDTYQEKSSEFYKKAYAFSEFDLAWFVVWQLIPKQICRYFGIGLIREPKFSYFKQLSQNILDQRRQNKSSVQQNDFIQALLDAKIPEKYQNIYDTSDDIDAHYNNNLSHNELEQIHRSQVNESKILFRSLTDIERQSQMTFFFLAGFDTTSSSLSLCIYCLAHNQELQEQVFKELQACPGLLDQLDYTDLLNLKELDAFISESLRLFAPVSDISRLVTQDEGLELPTNPPIWLPNNTSISINPFVVHHDPKCWTNPLEFDMSRFYKENKSSIKSGSYLPFGIGPRTCIGTKFALLTIKLTLAHLLNSYRIFPGSKSQVFPPDFTKHGFFTQLRNIDFVLQPRM